MPSTGPTIKMLLGLERHGIKPGLARISELLSLIDDPHKAYPAVHVAGTNGKGSTSAIVASVLREAGLKTGLYTSPHLSRFNERIQVSGRLVSEKELALAARVIKRASRRMSKEASPLTFFEFTTAMAFLHFKLRQADIAVIETGMGGRFDATNVVVPEVSVITNINIEHTRYLGKGLKDIAREKAGIIKPGRPVITGEDKAAALSVIRGKAQESSSALYGLGRDFSSTGEPASFDYSGLNLKLRGLKLKLLGQHQIKNAALALAAIEVLKKRGFNIPVAAIRAGLRKALWPGRLEVISRRPLVVVDGAHNPAAAAVLADALKGLKWKRLIVVAGIMADKDVDGVLKAILPLADEVIATSPGNERTLPATELAKKIKRLGKPAIERPRVKDACVEALKMARPGDCVCATGSLFTVAEARVFLRRSLI